MTNWNLQISRLREREEIRALRAELEEKKAKIEAELTKLKEVALTYAPELLSARKSLKWDYKPGIHKLNSNYFKLDTAKLSIVYNSPAGGDKWLAKYGLSLKETITYSWKALTKKGVN